jgi:GNAT superfamily N-acetyltransferase
VDEASLIELSDLNFAEALRELTRRSGGTVVDEDGLLLYAGGHPLPVLQNGVMRTAAGSGDGDVVERARRFFAARGRGFSLIGRAHADTGLLAAARAAGLQPMGEMPAMVLEHRLAAAVPPAGIDLRRVRTAAEVAAFAAVAGAAYATMGMPPDVAPAAFSRPQALVAPHIAAFIAWRDGAPLSCAMTIVSHGVAGIYWVGTAPGARGRGLAELCTRAAGNAGFDLGARVASLQASPMGAPVYRRMGYREITRYPYLVQFPSG